MPGDPVRILAGRSAAFARKLRARARMRFLYGRPFSGRADCQLLILSIDERIPQSQVHPFHAYAKGFLARYDAELREMPVSRYMSARHPGLDNATTVCFQTRFDIPQAELDALLDRIRDRNPNARLVYLDWFAPTDLRLAHRIGPQVSVYVKKHVLAARSLYGLPTRGDTNLNDYYSRRFDLDLPETVFPIPAGFLDKLLVGPSFVTADFMFRAFHGAAPLGAGPRPIDLHARIAVEGTAFYRAMRGESRNAVQALSGVRTATGTGVGLIRYLHELQQSKICFSPFGYGEVCWRDFEAVMSGAALLKPDMSHIRTDPDIFVAGETYMPVNWDMSDFEDKVRLLLADDDLRHRLTANAFGVLHDYVTSGRFVTQMAPLFE